MRFKKTLATLLTGITLACATARSAIIDIPISFRNIQNNYLQTAYDNAQDGDTLRFVKVDQPDLHANLIADEEKHITIDMNGLVWEGGAEVISFSEGKGLTIENGTLVGSQFRVDGSANLVVNNYSLSGVRDDGFVKWNSSGNLTTSNGTEVGYTSNDNIGCLVNIENLIGNSQINVARNTLLYAKELVRVGTDEYAVNPSLSVVHNVTDNTSTPLVFDYNLSKVTGEIANNSFSRLETLVTNPLYARRLRIISNNIYDYDDVTKDGISEPLLAMAYESLSEEEQNLLEDNYFFNPEFAGIGYDFNLTESSPLVDRGINLGQAYKGLAPDIGRFESAYGGIPEPSTGLLVGLTAGALAMKRCKKGSGGKR